MIIPDTAKEKPSQGEIIAVGPGGRDENGKLIAFSPRSKAMDCLFFRWRADGGRPRQMTGVFGVVDQKRASPPRSGKSAKRSMLMDIADSTRKPKHSDFPQHHVDHSQGHHKTSGLSVAIINRMLASPGLPPRVRLKIFEYIEEKSSGVYGER